MLFVRLLENFSNQGLEKSKNNPLHELFGLLYLQPKITQRTLKLTMRKLILLCIFSLLSFAHLCSQRLTENFEITLPDQKVEHSLYRTIECIDSRYDTTFMGIIQLGAFNKKAKVIPENSFFYTIAKRIKFPGGEGFKRR